MINTVKIFLKTGAVLSLALLFLLNTKQAQASVLLPGTIYSCGEISSVGTYTLSATSTFTPDGNNNCFLISSGGTSTQTIIDGNGRTITGNINGDNLNLGQPGYSFSIRNITVNGTTSATAGDISDCQANDDNGASGGTINVINSTTTAIVANGSNNGTVVPCDLVQSRDLGGYGGSIIITNSSFSSAIANGGNSDFVGGNGGSIKISSTNLSISSSTILSVKAGIIGSAVYNGQTYFSLDGSLEIDFTTFDYQHYTFPALSSLILNGPGNLPGLQFNYTNLPDFPGGLFPPTFTTTCASVITTPGIYILEGDVTGDCRIESNVVTIDGAGHTINGNVVGDATSSGNPGFNFTIEYVTVTGSTTANALDGGRQANVNGGSITIINSTTTAVSANAAYSPRGFTCGLCGPSGGGTGGTIWIASSSVIGPISSNSPLNRGGVGGNIVISGSDLSFYNQTISAAGDMNGTLNLNFNTATSSNMIISPLQNLTLNWPGNPSGSLGPYGGGSFFFGNNITDASQCNLGLAGTYYLGNDISGDCRILANGVIIDGLGKYTINGNVTGDAIQSSGPSNALMSRGFNFTLKNITITGTTSSIGTIYFPGGQGVPISAQAAAGGDITILNSTTSDIVSSGINPCTTSGFCGSGGSVTVTNSVTGNINASGDNDYSTNPYYGSKGGNGGTISVSTSTTASLTSNGGTGQNGGGRGGIINVNYSFENIVGSTILAKGGDSTSCGFGGSGGSINLVGSTYTGATSTSQGQDNSSGNNNCQPMGSSGTPGQFTSYGTYTPPPSTSQNNNLPPQVMPSPNTERAPSASIGGSTTIIPGLNAPAITAPEEPQTFTEKAVTVVKNIVQTADTVVSSPISKSVQATGFLAGLIASVGFYTDTALATPLAAADAAFIPVRLWGLMLVGLGIRRRARPWGTVFDSVTKQPIDPAIVKARNKDGKVVAEAITDIDGRYGFLLPDGVYYLSAQKTNYEFPSKKLEGVMSDDLYDKLYFGEPVEIKEGEVIDRNIPLDQKNFDWNEFAKRENNIMTFHTKHEKPWTVASNYIYDMGLVISFVATMVRPTVYNVILLCLYVAVFAFMRFGVKRKKLGTLLDSKTSEPLPFAIVRVTTPDHSVTLRSSVSDGQGRYYCIVPKGEYLINIEKKNTDGSYTKVYESGRITNKSGIINQDFSV